MKQDRCSSNSSLVQPPKETDKRLLTKILTLFFKLMNRTSLHSGGSGQRFKGATLGVFLFAVFLSQRFEEALR